MNVGARLSFSNSSQAKLPAPWWEDVWPRVIESTAGGQAEHREGARVPPRPSTDSLASRSQCAESLAYSYQSPEWAAMEIDSVSECELSGDMGAQQGILAVTR